MKKPTKKKQITTPSFIGKFGWLCCPHCENTIIFGMSDDIDVLKKWKKQGQNVSMRDLTHPVLPQRKSKRKYQL